MEDILKLQLKIVPELVDLLSKRYNILRTIYYNQPIGRRGLASSLELGERIVRSEVDFLKSVKLIDVSAAGMSVTYEGEQIIENLKTFIHKIKGLSEIEGQIKELLNLSSVIVVPGDMDEDSTIIKEIGRAAAGYVRNILKSNSIVALTGGTAVKEVIDNMPQVNNLSNVLCVPARGGIGREVEIQANTLAASLANKIGATYKLLHVPDNLSDTAMDAMRNEKDIKDILGYISNASVLIYGIGRADKMAEARGVTHEKFLELLEYGTVGEAFGCYFNRKGEVIYSTRTIGINIEDLKYIDNPIAVAGGKSKGEAIIATERNNPKAVLITDEGAAKEIIRIMKDSNFV